MLTLNWSPAPANKYSNLIKATDVVARFRSMATPADTVRELLEGSGRQSPLCEI